MKRKRYNAGKNMKRCRHLAGYKSISNRRICVVADQ